MDKILSWLDPTSWVVRIVAAVLIVAALSFGWYKFKLYIAEPYVVANRVEMQHTIDAHISEKVDIQSKLDSLLQASKLEKERQVKEAKLKETTYKKDIANAKTENENLKSVLLDTSTSLNSLRDTSDRIRSSCTAGSSEFSLRIGDALRESETDLTEALTTTADAIEIAREAIAAAKALQK